MTLQAVLLPVFVQFGLMTFLLLWMVADRQKLFKSGALRFKDIALGQQEPLPLLSRQIGNAYNNQFQMPVLFLALVPLVILARKADLTFVVLEWCFVVSRLMHAYVHTTSNHGTSRGNWFAVGSSILLLMWAFFAVRLFLSPPIEI
ncbi:MAPEG family protein [Beijerinckia indica]|uniref:MAPEG family protein n=1 Tax=Beijerinckia indica subsp. indica (strain ATCC 9039 / DSM 1715 / NCIMB 8712) TaxID=395963 RepID=B2IEE8_BEII9|nr:MAPEG family protein [Beijerinckia indica]ACB95546.1 protein of unknown function DUF1123 [Beijerinckia indica subsp. indica ATCC 9039]